MPIIRKELRSEDVYPLALRVSGGLVQRTSDGGITWVNSPQDDPRHNPAYLKASLGASNQCPAARSMVQWIHDRTDQIVDGLDAAWTFSATALAILTPFTELFPIEVLLEILIELVGDIAGLTALAVVAAMTDTVYTDLRCILHCNVSSNGQMSAAQLGVATAQCDAHFTGVAKAVIDLWLADLGEVGLSNAGTLGLGTGDCSGCSSCTWCYTFDFTIDARGWLPEAAKPWGAYYSARWNSQITSGLGGGQGLFISINPGVTFNITGLEVRFHSNSVSNGNGSIIFGGFTRLSWSAKNNGDFTVSGATNANGTEVKFEMGNGSGPGAGNSFYLTRIKLSGGGQCPFGTSNC